MEQLVAIVLVVVVVCAAGIGLGRGGPVARVVGRLLLIAGGCATGFLLALLLELTLWPGAFGAIFGAYTPPTPVQDRWAGLMFAAIVGGAGAVMPNVAFRLGYAAGALLVILVGSDDWVGHNSGPLLLVGLGCWAVVALLVRAIRWWLRPDPDT